MPTKIPALTQFLQVIWISSLAALLPFATLGQGRLDKTGWQLDPNLSEDFNVGTTLATLAPRWHVQLENGVIANKSSALPFESYVTRNNVYIANGCAYLNTYKYTAPIYHENNRDYYYATSFLRSRFDDFPTISPPNDTVKGGVLYGMFEIRCKLPRGSGQYPSFWLAGNNAWPPEIDAFEFNGSHPKTFFSTAHWPNPAFKEGSSVSRDSSHGKTYTYASKKFLTKGFHTWTVVWAPKRITWFFDNKELYTDTIAAHIPGGASPDANPYELCKYRKMDMIINSILNYPDSTATNFEPLVIDYIHMYRPVGFVPYNPAQPLAEYLASLNALYNKIPYQSKPDRRGR
jgi:hypothetical protein